MPGRGIAHRAAFIGVIALVQRIAFAPAWSAAIAGAQHNAGDVLDPRPAVILPELGHVHHPISTRSSEAQHFFDQGLTLVYGFNHEGAYRAFREAARLDPTCAMAYWGMAQALSPNINDDVNLEWERVACNALDKGLAVPNVSDRELAYLQAQLLRHSRDPRADFKQRAVQYSRAMQDLHKRWPSDPDAATLYVESLFNLHPWSLWTPDRKPTGPDTVKCLAVLESVLKSHPDHIGANHYYIHALEPGPRPERALASAKRLETLAPGQGHLRHMPSHVYMHTGDYQAAAECNQAAIRSDREYAKLYGSDGDYPMYLGHNIDFLRYAYTMAGRYKDAKRAADELAANIAPEIAAVPMGQPVPSRERYMAASLLVQARSYRWNEILALTPPDAKLPRTTALWHYARGMAYSANGEADKADAERAAFLNVGKSIPGESGFGLNDWKTIQKIGTLVLDGKIASARGDYNGAVSSLRQAVRLQDGLAYDETPDWYYPVRESLGAALIRAGQASEAEKVFCEDLSRNPGNGRSLFGLAESLRLQHRVKAVRAAMLRYRSAWRRADFVLRTEDM